MLIYYKSNVMHIDFYLFFLFLMKILHMETASKFESTIEKLFDVIIVKLPSIAVALLILLIGRYVIRLVLNMINKRFAKRNVDLSIRSFMSSMIQFVLWGLLVLTVASTMGIQTTSFIAALSAFGLAVGMALQGSLSNFAGGVLILLFRPFEVEDYISSANGSGGTVEKIDLLYTTLIDDEGIKIFSPNGTLANSVIKNYTKISNRRMQFTMNIAYDVDVQAARAGILQTLAADSRIVTLPKASVHVGDLTEAGMQLVVRAWAKREDYWAVKAAIAEELQSVVDSKSVAFPQASIKVLSAD